MRQFKCPTCRGNPVKDSQRSRPLWREARETRAGKWIPGEAITPRQWRCKKCGRLRNKRIVTRKKAVSARKGPPLLVLVFVLA